MNHHPQDNAADIAALLADLRADETVRYLDLQRSEAATRALGRWPLLRRIDAALRAAPAGEPAP